MKSVNNKNNIEYLQPYLLNGLTMEDICPLHTTAQGQQKEEGDKFKQENQQWPPVCTCV